MKTTKNQKKKVRMKVHDDQHATAPVQTHITPESSNDHSVFSNRTSKS